MAIALVADDYEGARDLIRRILESEGWQVVEAADGPAALDCALAHACDILLLDEIMPGATGTAVLRQLRAAGVRAPAVLVSAVGAPEDDPGFAAVILKPFVPAQLRVVVASALRLARS